MTPTPDNRWKQRFENYQNALAVLDSAVAAVQAAPEDILYRIALIQSFKFSWELGWKVMKDYLNYEGIEVQPSPRQVIKQAFQQQIISDGQLWIDMLEARNTMSHAYDNQKAQQAAKAIQRSYHPALVALSDYFTGRVTP
ncbi:MULTISPECIES: nucleotidyltransferase substrate binding protein [unclassified Endozoicomonas]|uniref:nucleotidyltransferase substrate binding protein n=1 Tax=unclassified Endozoicomonas TaxID=2644528 RepID=UPI003BB59C5B